VVDVGSDGSFKMDANHVLAGQALTYQIELLVHANPPPFTP